MGFEQRDATVAQLSLKLVPQCRHQPGL